MPIKKVQPSLPPVLTKPLRLSREKLPEGKDSYLDAARMDPRLHFDRMLLGSPSPTTDAAPPPSPWAPLYQEDFKGIKPTDQWDFERPRGKSFPEMKEINEFLAGGGWRINEVGDWIVKAKTLNMNQAKAIVDQLKRKTKYPQLKAPKTPKEFPDFAKKFIQQHLSAYQEAQFYDRLLSLEGNFVVSGDGTSHPIFFDDEVKRIFLVRREVLWETVHQNYLKIAAAMNRHDPSGTGSQKPVVNAELMLLTHQTDPIEALKKFLEYKKLTPDEARKKDGTFDETIGQRNHKVIALAAREQFKREWFAPPAAVAPAPAAATIEGSVVSLPSEMYTPQEREAIIQYVRFFRRGVLVEMNVQRARLQTKWESSPQWRAFEDEYRKKNDEILSRITQREEQIRAGIEKFIPDLAELDPPNPEDYAKKTIDELVQTTKLVESASETVSPPPETIETLQTELVKTREELETAMTKGVDAEITRLRTIVSLLENQIKIKNAPEGETAPLPPAASEPPAVAAVPAEEPAPEPAPEPVPLPPAISTLPLPPAAEEIPAMEEDIAPPELPTTVAAKTGIWGSAGISAVYFHETETRYTPPFLSMEGKQIFEEYRGDYERTLQTLPRTKNKENVSSVMGRLNGSVSPLFLLGPEGLAALKFLAEAEVGNGEVQGRIGVGLSLEPWLGSFFINDLSAHLFLGRWVGNENTNFLKSGSGIFQPGVCAAAGYFQTCFDWRQSRTETELSTGVQSQTLRLFTLSVGLRKTFSGLFGL